MANPQRNDDELRGLNRANRDDEQHWSDSGWEAIEGGRSEKKRETIGADFTRSPYDPSLVRDEAGLLPDNTVTGYGEPLAEKNYPRAYNTDDLVNTDLNPAAVYPKRTSATFRIVAVVLGLALFGLLLAILWAGFLAPVRRTPEGPRNGSITQPHRSDAALQQFAGFVYRMNERR